MKISANVRTAIEPYQEAIAQIRDMGNSCENLEHKKLLLEKEVAKIQEELSALELGRPKLLEKILDGTQPENALIDHEMAVNRLKAERKSKETLIDLINHQMTAKTEKIKSLKSGLDSLRRRIFAAIEEDLVATMPQNFLPFITKLAAAAGVNGRSWTGVIQGLMPERWHNDWELERRKIFEDLGLSS